jgi:iron complex outermembrane receptor protein
MPTPYTTLHPLIIKIGIASICLAAAFWLQPSAYAQADSTDFAHAKIDTVEVPSLTVTSTRAVERQSPVAFSTIKKPELELLYTTRDLPQILQTQPSVITYSESGNFIGYTNMSLRGFDQRRLAVMVNGIPQNDPEDHNVYWINFSDIGSSLYDVQIQRGAGLMNYGAAAIAGSINLTTSIEAANPGIRYETGIGIQEFGATDELRHNVSRNMFEVASGITQIDDTDYAFYGKLTQINSDGYRNQSWAELTSWFVSGARFDENLTTQINVWGGSQRDGLAYVGLPKNYVNDLQLRRNNFNGWGYDSDGSTVAWSADVRPQEVEEFSSPHAELLNDWQVSENITIKSSLFAYAGSGYFDFDGSWATDEMFRLGNQYDISGGDYATNSIIRAYVSNMQYGWIPRMIWDHGDGQLTAGLEMRSHRSEHWGKIQYAENLPTGFDPDYKFYEHEGERTILSAFARESYKLNEMLTIHAGGQLVYHNYTKANEKVGGEFSRYQVGENLFQSGDGNLFSIDYLFFNPRLGINLLLDDNNSGYASVALTNREPRMNNLYSASDSYFETASNPNIGGLPLFAQDSATKYYDFSNPLVVPEQMLDLEIGYRYSDERINIGLGGYWMEFTNELVGNGQINKFGSPIDGNAPRSRHLGLELDFAGELFTVGEHRFTAGGNATLSTNELLEYSVFFEDDDPLVESPVEVDLSGNEISGFPSSMANLYIMYDYSGLMARIDGRAVSSFYTDNYGDRIGEEGIQKYVGYSDNVVDSYFILSADLSYELKDILGTQSLRLRLNVNNITNELYSPSGIGRNFFPAAERNYYFGMVVAI